MRTYNMSYCRMHRQCYVGKFLGITVPYIFLFISFILLYTDTYKRNVRRTEVKKKMVDTHFKNDFFRRNNKKAIYEEVPKIKSKVVKSFRIFWFAYIYFLFCVISVNANIGCKFVFWKSFSSMCIGAVACNVMCGSAECYKMV